MRMSSTPHRQERQPGRHPREIARPPAWPPIASPWGAVALCAPVRSRQGGCHSCPWGSVPAESSEVIGRRGRGAAAPRWTRGGGGVATATAAAPHRVPRRWCRRPSVARAGRAAAATGHAGTGGGTALMGEAQPLSSASPFVATSSTLRDAYARVDKRGAGLGYTQTTSPSSASPSRTGLRRPAEPRWRSANTPYYGFRHQTRFGWI